MDTTSLLKRYRAAVTRLQSVIHKKDSHDYMQRGASKEECFARTKAFFALLGNPQQRFQVVHVAGTAGKGSTASLIAHMLNVDTHSVGLLTSPFVSTTLENIWINGKLCDPELFIVVANHVLNIVDGIDPAHKPSYAEILFAIGVLCCANSGCTWLVTEVGCGGRFDYTNIFDQPTLCVITPIDYDHMNILGETLPEIAWHKAGIIHTGCSVLSSAQVPEVRVVIDAEVKKYNLSVEYAGDAPAVTSASQQGMRGIHQQGNQLLATRAAGILRLSPEAIAQGIAQAQLPARCEVMQNAPLVIIDGAHSPIKIQSLVDYLSTECTYEKLYVIYSAKETKDPEKNIAPLLPLSTAIWCTEFHLPGFGSHSSEEMKAVIERNHPQATIHAEPNPNSAYAHALSVATEKDCILITGSLYLAGIVRERFFSEESIVLSQEIFAPKYIVKTNDASPEENGMQVKI